MPELPEVETIKRELEKEILNKEIKEAEILDRKVINLPIEDFKKKIKGKKIKFIRRRAKLLIFGLSDNLNLFIHLKLTGQLIYKKYKKEEKYTSLIFYFADNSLLYFSDLRKFGYIKLLGREELDKFLEKMNLGPEPLEKEFTFEKFQELLKQKPKAKIKPLLMDQSFIAGVGNIYAQEACFEAKVLPTRLVNSLKEKEIEDLYQGLTKVLKAAIKKKGTSVDTYLDIYGQKGEYMPLLKVYQRQGEKCFRCGAMIKKVNLTGRGTCFCPKCQK